MHRRDRDLLIVSAFYGLTLGVAATAGYLARALTARPRGA